MSSWLVLVLVLTLLYLLYKLVVFVRADADLTLLSRTLDTRYFDNKVVWVTGASSGSTWDLKTISTVCKTKPNKEIYISMGEISNCPIFRVSVAGLNFFLFQRENDYNIRKTLACHNYNKWAMHPTIVKYLISQIMTFFSWRGAVLPVV